MSATQSLSRKRPAGNRSGQGWCLPRTVQNFGLKLTAQQLWCWGQDIERRDGNLLVQYGMTQQRYTGRDERSTCYRLDDGQTAICLWGFGLFFGLRDVGGLYLGRFDFRPQWTECFPAPCTDRPNCRRCVARAAGTNGSARIGSGTGCNCGSRIMKYGFAAQRGPRGGRRVSNHGCDPLSAPGRWHRPGNFSHYGGGSTAISRCRVLLVNTRCLSPNVDRLIEDHRETTACHCAFRVSRSWQDHTAQSRAHQSRGPACGGHRQRHERSQY